MLWVLILEPDYYIEGMALIVGLTKDQALLHCNQLLLPAEVYPTLSGPTAI